MAVSIRIAKLTKTPPTGAFALEPSSCLVTTPVQAELGAPLVKLNALHIKVDPAAPVLSVAPKVVDADAADAGEAARATRSAKVR
jgi:hypothetical protein